MKRKQSHNVDMSSSIIRHLLFTLIKNKSANILIQI